MIGFPSPECLCVFFLFPPFVSLPTPPFSFGPEALPGTRGQRRDFLDGKGGGVAGKPHPHPPSTGLGALRAGTGPPRPRPGTVATATGSGRPRAAGSAARPGRGLCFLGRRASADSEVKSAGSEVASELFKPMQSRHDRSLGKMALTVDD